MSHEVKIVYFSWVRERVGKPEETITLPDEVISARDLLTWLPTQGEEYAAAFEFPDIIRVALDQEHVEHDHALRAAREIAIFPPMTGG